jgi:copper(I)-binding protein
MLSGLDKGLKLGDKIEVLLEFKNNENIILYPTLKIKPPKL